MLSARLADIGVGGVSVMFFILDETKEYLGICTCRQVSVVVVVSCHVAMCYGETGKTLSS